MNDAKPIPGARAQRARLPHHLRELLHRLLFETHRGATRQDFLRQAVGRLLDFAGCDLVEVRIREDGRISRCEGILKESGGVRYDYNPPAAGRTREARVLEEILDALLQNRFTAAAPFTTRFGSFWVDDTARPILLRALGGENGPSSTLVLGGSFQSLAVIPFPVTERATGILYLASGRRDFFHREDVLFYEVVAVTLGVAIANQAAQWALRERVKELTCLYGIAKATQRLDRPVEELLQEAVELLPPGWQYPEITSARITLGGRAYETTGFVDHPHRQAAQIVVNGERRGAVEVVYTEPRPVLDEGPFLKEERHLINAIAETLGVTISYREAQLALRERVKELTCLHGIAKIAQRPGASLVEILAEIVELLPPGLLYPDIAEARIVLEGQCYATQGFVDRPDGLGADITTEGKRRGRVEVIYRHFMPEIDEGPFLKEERSLLNEVARQVGLIVERREAEDERARLQQQLRHADRLATIGQLAAGAAHELNEPLGNILGFAELAGKLPRLPRQARADLEKIVDSALHAREIIKKLMIFARQMPTQMESLDLNEVVGRGIQFLESRLEQEDIGLVQKLGDSLPRICGDASQLQQVLVNLVVNALQAMPSGGTVTVRTAQDGTDVLLIVEDTGVGMSADVLKQIFLPFFTTKQVGHGTGLGLSVVHGIVTSHNGTISVESREGRGSRFEIRFPAAHSQALM